MILAHHGAHDAPRRHERRGARACPATDRALRLLTGTPPPHTTPAPGSRLPPPGSRLPAPASRLPPPASRLPAPGSRLPAPGSRIGAAPWLRGRRGALASGTVVFRPHRRCLAGLGRWPPGPAAVSFRAWARRLPHHAISPGPVGTRAAATPSRRSRSRGPGAGRGTDGRKTEAGCPSWRPGRSPQVEGRGEDPKAEGRSPKVRPRRRPQARGPEPEGETAAKTPRPRAGATSRDGARGRRRFRGGAGRGRHPP
ncbi:hypothetical protein JOF35_005928 [Streptomyces demainii]|uniref:Uncharacterized protein n=1 Tax=Streptomyces demainii TaxID=588122 RepID=A0ABT9KYQ9_9ACTN|nr:hypothetical protein [Streptomyces demainii]